MANGKGYMSINYCMTESWKYVRTHLFIYIHEHANAYEIWGRKKKWYKLLIWS